MCLYFNTWWDNCLMRLWAYACIHNCTAWCSSFHLCAHWELLFACLQLCLSSSATCCMELTNYHGTVPSTSVTDVWAGRLLMKIGSVTSIGRSSGGPWFILPLFVPEATGSALSANTDPGKNGRHSHAMSCGIHIKIISVLLKRLHSAEAILCFN